jgi:hypothetical protein
VHDTEKSGEASPSTQVGSLGLDALAGRLCEISGLGATCVTSFVFGLVREAQLRGEPAAWILVRPRLGASQEPAPFMAEDLLRLGLDLAALPFVITADLAEAGRAATHLLRSGAFLLVVLDTLELEASEVELPLPLMSRLHGLALKHEAALVVLTSRPPDAPSLGSLVAFRAHLQRGRERLLPEDGDPDGPGGDGLTRVMATLTVDKDKRRGPGLQLTHVFSGPPGFLGPTRAP